MDLIFHRSEKGIRNFDDHLQLLRYLRRNCIRLGNILMECILTIGIYDSFHGAEFPPSIFVIIAEFPRSSCNV